MRTVTALSLAALALSGAACGTSSGQLEGASEAAPTTPDQVRTVQTPYGAQAVPLEPQRIVTLEGRRDFETMVALGLTPVAAGYQGDRDQPFARFIDADVDDVQLAFPANNEDLEVLAGLEPDLIVGRDVQDLDILDALTEIAPVLSVAGGGDWQVDLRRIATAVGREDRAEELLADYEQRLAEVRAEHREQIETAKVGVLQYSPGEFSWSAPKGFYLQSQVLTALGGTFPDFLAAAGNDDFDASEQASSEQLGQLVDADALLVVANVLADDDVDDRVALEADPLWSRLPAVQAGRVVFTDFSTNYGSYYAALEALRLLDQTYGTLDEES